MKKKEIENYYNQVLETIIERFKIPGTTYLTQLNDIGNTLFGRNYIGTFPADKEPKLHNRQMCIMNLDPTGLPGSHWIALAKDNDEILIYDSFGRPTKDIYKTTYKNQKYTATEDDAEQDESEENCGARCLAFLQVFKALGASAAINI